MTCIGRLLAWTAFKAIAKGDLKRKPCSEDIMAAGKSLEASALTKLRAMVNGGVAIDDKLMTLDCGVDQGSLCPHDEMESSRRFLFMDMGWQGFKDGVHWFQRVLFCFLISALGENFFIR